MPLPQGTAANGTLPMEQTKEPGLLNSPRMMMVDVFAARLVFAHAPIIRSMLSPPVRRKRHTRMAETNKATIFSTVV